MSTKPATPGQGPGFVVENHFGRVIHARVFALRTVDAAEQYSRSLAAVVARVPADRRPILCADHRPVVIYPQPVTDRLTELFLAMNARLERVAILVARTNATLAMQLERIVREAQFERRRVFYDADRAAAHLHDALTPDERAGLDLFLAEWSNDPRSPSEA